jgi:hypothetical protein
MGLQSGKIAPLGARDRELEAVLREAAALFNETSGECGLLRR